MTIVILLIIFNFNDRFDYKLHYKLYYALLIDLHLNYYLNLTDPKHLLEVNKYYRES